MLYNVFGKIEINEWSEIIEFATDRYVSRKQAKTE